MLLLSLHSKLNICLLDFLIGQKRNVFVYAEQVKLNMVHYILHCSLYNSLEVKFNLPIQSCLQAQPADFKIRWLLADLGESVGYRLTLFSVVVEAFLNWISAKC